MPGFVAIDFTRGDAPGQQKILLSSDNETLTKEQLIESLGKHASRYVVKDLSRQ